MRWRILGSSSLGRHVVNSYLAAALSDREPPHILEPGLYVRVVPDAPPGAFEQCGVDGVKAHCSREQPQVCLCEPAMHIRAVDVGRLALL